MQSPNLSKLIVWFIAIALVSSSALFAFSSYINNPGTVKPATSTAISPLDKPFTENLPTGATDAEIAALQAEEKDNATLGLVNVLAQEIVNKNPQGPLNAAGQLSMAAPDNLNSLIDDYIKTHPFSGDSLKPSIQDKDINIVDTSDSAAFNNYFSNLGSIVLNLNSEYGLTDPTDSTAKLDAYTQILQKYDGELRNLQVPKPLASLHKSILATIDVSLNYTALSTNDPLGAVALSDVYDRELSRAVNDFDSQTKDLNKLSLAPSEHRNIIQVILGVHTALAAGIGVPVEDQNSIWQQIKKFVYDYKKDIKAMLLDFLKNTLLRKMTKQVVNWVAGGPEPQFVTNWNTFFTDASIDAAGHVLAQAAPQLCGAGSGGGGGPGTIDGLGDFAGFIKKVMTPINTAGIQTNGFGYPGCTLTDAIISINDFKQDFRNGGWKAYATVLQPQNTILGSLITLSDRQLIAAAQAQAEASAKAVSGGGFTGQMACDNGEPPSQQDTQHGDGEGGTFTIPKGSCADGSKPHVTTPGVFSKDLSTQGFNAAYNRLVTAGDYKALVAYIADVALNRLFQEGAKGLLSYARKQGNGSYNPGTGDTGAPPISTAPLPETPANNAKDLARQILVRKQSALDDARSTVSSLSDTITLLQQTVSACTSNQAVVDGARAEITALAGLKTDLLLKVEALKPQVDGLQKFIASPTTIADLTAQFGTLEDAQTEADDMSVQRQKADAVYGQAGQLYASCSNDTLDSTSPPSTPP